MASMLTTQKDISPLDAAAAHTKGVRAALFLWTSDATLSRVLEPHAWVTVGRGSGVDVQVEDPTVSRVHARFRFDGLRVQVEDMGSTHGLTFAGSKNSAVLLDDGQHVMLGSVVAGVRFLPALTDADLEHERLGRRTIQISADRASETVLWLSPQMQALDRQITRIAKFPATVLIRGETGTGKELVARALHERGPGLKKPFRVLNCGAIPINLVESVLFGNVRGAFTGADQARAGVFEEANGGTIFLDEVAELPPAAQATLLRVLETKRVSRVGSSQEVAVDVRILSATHRNVEAMVEAGTFRLDLMHRLDAVSLHVPALRERREEIRPLAEHFIAEALRSNGEHKLATLDESFLQALERYSWPGNVRELRNAVQRAVALCENGTLHKDLLPERVLGAALAMPSSSPQEPRRELKTIDTLRKAQEDLETAAIREALKRTGGNRTQAALLMKMPLRTFLRRVKKLETEEE